MQIRCQPLLQRINLWQSEMANPDKGPEFHGVGEIRLENYSVFVKSSTSEDLGELDKLAMERKNDGDKSVLQKRMTLGENVKWLLLENSLAPQKIKHRVTM